MLNTCPTPLLPNTKRFVKYWYFWNFLLPSAAAYLTVPLQRSFGFSKRVAFAGLQPVCEIGKQSVTCMRFRLPSKISEFYRLKCVLRKCHNSNGIQTQTTVIVLPQLSYVPKKCWLIAFFFRSRTRDAFKNSKFYKLASSLAHRRCLFPFLSRSNSVRLCCFWEGTPHHAEVGYMARRWNQPLFLPFGYDPWAEQSRVAAVAVSQIEGKREDISVRTWDCRPIISGIIMTCYSVHWATQI